MPRAPVRVLMVRTALFTLLWLILMGGPVQLGFGVATAAIAAWTSVRLLPPGCLRVRPIGLLTLLPHFLWQSVVAGVDVARRAFDPRLPLKTGFVVFLPQTPPGPARNALTGYTSLLPGTVPCGERDGGVVYHCLDVDEPIVEQLAAEESRLRLAITPGDRHDG